ncbi:hypothetical protein M2171_003252 [Bradyrhizobium japonicum USDA 38]|uniref:hypothetical protein n=1 Tax=Bradyrhizobium japonicum TaxID=375 RepID=UPI001FD944D4|nr:hypothetical protein [Bradyrhizobium japonicum]MCS3894119.1 hypothetical protein [Bradyrhizobium japonicum USDA 38]
MKLSRIASADSSSVTDDRFGSAFPSGGYQDRGRAHQFALSLGSLGGYIAPPEGMTMVREQKSGAGTNAQRSHGSQVGSGDLQARIAALRSLPREKLADAVFMLWMETQRQSKLIRRAATERVEGDTGPEPIPNADLATYLADEAVSSLRHHEVDIPSLADVLIQRPARFASRSTEPGPSHCLPR